MAGVPTMAGIFDRVCKPSVVDILTHLLLLFLTNCKIKYVTLSGDSYQTDNFFYYRTIKIYIYSIFDWQIQEIAGYLFRALMYPTLE